MSQLIYQLLNVHVHTSDEDVIEKLKSRLKDDATLSPAVERSVLEAHADARRLFEEWRF